MEAGWFESGRGGSLTGELPDVVCLSLYWKDMAKRLHRAVVVVPGDPFRSACAARSNKPEQDETSTATPRPVNPLVADPTPARPTQ